MLLALTCSSSHMYVIALSFIDHFSQSYCGNATKGVVFILLLGGSIIGTAYRNLTTF